MITSPRVPAARGIAPDRRKPLSAIRVDRGEGDFVDSSLTSVYKTCVNSGRSRALFLGSRAFGRDFDCPVTRMWINHGLGKNHRANLQVRI